MVLFFMSFEENQRDPALLCGVYSPPQMDVALDSKHSDDVYTVTPRICLMK